MRICLVGLILAVPSIAAALWPPPDADLNRPRILWRADEVGLVQSRLGRSPYDELFRGLNRRIRQADGIPLDDHSINAERIKARAAKNLAFAYAVDRTVVGGDVVPFASPDERRAAGARVRDLLLNMYTRSRLVIDPPLGGWDRDINTSEELLQYATAYDTLAGAGYDFGDSEPQITDNIAALAGELYDNFAHPETAFTFPNLHQNNHRSKSGAALAVAAIALADYVPSAGSDPRGVRQPVLWADLGADLVDFIVRYVLMTGDGAYAEGPFYWRYSSQNLLPFARAWDSFVGGEYVTAEGLHIPNLWRHPLFARSQRWMLDMTLPDGSLAPVDDGNPGRSHYFGIQPPGVPWLGAAAWRWAEAPAPYETEGSVDLSADSIVAFDDSIVAARPTDSPSAFYVEGGNAIFRSDWSDEAVVAIVQGEHDTASEFGRDRAGRGVGPQSHEHAEPGSFLLNAYGETLALDPGYLDFLDHAVVNQPQHHNMVLVDGKGPVDYLDGSSRWRRRTGRPPVDGHAMIFDTLDSSFIDRATVVSRYGRYPDPSPEIERRFLFVEDSFLIILDTLTSASSPAPTFTLQLHGNGGADSGGTFEATDFGGRWTRPSAQLDWLILTDVESTVFDTVTAVHEIPGGQRREHSVRRAHVVGDVARAIEIVYPSRAEDQPPQFRVLERGDDLAVRIEDTARDRVYVVERFATAGKWRTIATTAIETDGDFAIVGYDSRGELRLVYGEQLTSIGLESSPFFEDVVRGHHGLRFGSDTVEVVSDDAQPRIGALPFEPGAVDGAGELNVDSDGVRVATCGSKGFRLLASTTPGNPSAMPLAVERVQVGELVTLDGSNSCDPTGAPLSSHWELVSAPAGSAWHLDDTNASNARLLVDRPGPYRARLTVTRLSDGISSEAAELLVVGGDLCADGIDDDRDGLFDSDDPNCDQGGECVADCSGEGQVDVDELLRAVNIALGERPASNCRAADSSGDQEVTVDELLAAIDAALAGCLQREGI